MENRKNENIDSKNYNKFNFFNKPLKNGISENTYSFYGFILAFLILTPFVIANDSIILAIRIFNLLSVISYSSGVFFALKSILVFKEYLKFKTTPLSNPITLLIVSILLIYLPSFISH